MLVNYEGRSMYFVQGYLFLVFISFCVYTQSYDYISRRSQPIQRQNYRYKELINMYESRNLEFGFPSESERQATLRDGRYNPDSPLPIDVDVYYSPRYRGPTIFITIPRFGKGVPYSLAYLTNVRRPNGTELQPYPSYEWHWSHGRDCNGLTSVCRVHIDPCGRMWILDSGEIDNTQYCPPQIVVIDLATNKALHRYRLPEAMFKRSISRFVTPYVDVLDPPPHGRCQRIFVYMADATGFGIVVYDVQRAQSWRIENKYTYPDPDFSTHTIAGESFELLEGTIGLSVTPLESGVQRWLYFHSFSNDAQVAIPLDIVNNSTFWENGLSSAISNHILLGKRGVQCAASAMTSNGVLLCGHYAPIGLFGWNILTPYAAQNRFLLAENPNTLQFVSGLKVITNRLGKEEVWMLSNRIQKAFTGRINYNEINYRIMRCGVDELLLGLPC
ncbi:major royal jelly protein 1-like [Anastrepha ludens]|uniref:major royal jelly protein 1-like n=1 Tax=Anastrepha ludens TaxID=28586 RepID=UPI0023B02B41|nr:major royal jelly protein 1-like [Anastrepha ludens]